MKIRSLRTTLAFAVLTMLGACAGGPTAEEFEKLRFKADSCYVNYEFQAASAFYSQALHSKAAEAIDYYHGACCASLAGEFDVAINRLQTIIKKFPAWYNENLETDGDLMFLHEDPRWKEIVKTFTETKKKQIASYEHPLYEELNKIREEDQAIRQVYFQAYMKRQNNIGTIEKEMHRLDSLHMIYVDNLLEKKGWPDRFKVGDANYAIWLTIQHNGIDKWKQYLPMLKKQARNGDIKKSDVALLEDRIEVEEGRPQIYGTHYYRGEDGKHYLSPLRDSANVDALRKSVGLGSLEYFKLEKGIE